MNLGGRLVSTLNYAIFLYVKSLIFKNGICFLLKLTKTRIKNLTGIRIKVIQELKDKLGKKININHIVIEGHTDSDGSYMHNLDLSQKRAYSVMAFICSWDEKRNTTLQ